METSAKILTDMHKLGLQTINIYNHIPHSMRTPNKIFGKKDLRLGHYVHYGDKVLQIINSMTEKKILEIKTTQGEGNDNTPIEDKTKLSSTKHKYNTTLAHTTSATSQLSQN